MIPPLAIIQARIHSTRLPRKMLLDLGGHPLIWWGWQRTVERYGFANTIIACPAQDRELEDAAPALFYWYEGEEWDVLGRFHACAHRNRTDPEAVIVRITPDDFPVALERERFTIRELDWVQELLSPHEQYRREHIGLLFPKWGRVGPGTIEVNTLEDLEAARRQLGQQ